MRYLKNVVTLQHDPAKCTGCGRCLEVCPHRVFKPSSGKVQIADRDKCMECGACARNCPFNAIEVEEGVGCAAAIIMSFFTGEEPTCG
jgi:NAD-dependent dihydropyrimidine dehydrogenase PreA subunit